REKRFLVLTGSSAGGIEALAAFVAHLPSDFPAPIVVAQHLSPTHVSHLGDILAQRTVLPVYTIGGMVELEPGTIYVVPPNHNVEIIDDSVTIKLQANRSPKPS